MKAMYVYENGGNNPHILCALDVDKYSINDNRLLYGIIHHKVNNVSTMELEIPTNCESSQQITKTSYLVFYDTYGNPQEYTITGITDLHEYGVSRTLYAEQSLIELIEDMITGTDMPKGTNVKDYLAYILSFTRWSVGTIDSSIAQRTWTDDISAKNCLEALQMLVDKYRCEFEVRYVTDNKNKITGRYIDLKKATGNNLGKRFEYTKDINSLKKTADLDNIKTAIYPRIAKQVQNGDGTTSIEYTDISSVSWSTDAGNPSNKPKGEVILVNPAMSAMWKRYNNKTGKMQERIMYAEWTEQSATDAYDLIGQAWAILRANGVPDESYEVVASDLYVLSGDKSLSHEQVHLGDTVTILDKEFTPEIRVQTRVVEIEEDLLNPVNNKYVFGKSRQTLATGKLDETKSIEDKLKELSNRIQGINIPEYELPYQSGQSVWESVKESSQNELLQSNGYTMMDDSDGCWVFDRPESGSPSKAVIIKGGSLAVAGYNSNTDSWEVGSFINGTSINASMLNTGTLKADVIGARTITAEMLTVAAINYIKSGMVTDEQLSTVIGDITNIQGDIDAINGNISDLNGVIDDAMKGALDASKVTTISNSLLSLQSEYDNTSTRAAKVYANQYLAGGSKVALNTKMGEYTTAYNNYVASINNAIKDNVVTDAEYTDYKNKAALYKTAIKNLSTAIEDANDAILVNVYSQAREGLVTEASLEVNNNNVIIKAREGMVNTGDMTSAIDLATEDLVSNGKLAESINVATEDLASINEVTDQVRSAKIGAIQESYKAITSEYKNNLQQATTIANDKYLTGTAKNNLANAKADYTNKYNALTTAIDSIVSDNSIDDAHMTAYNTAISNLQASTVTLGQRVQEAATAISAEIYKEAVGYANGLKVDIDSDIQDAVKAVGDLRDDVVTTIKDGIVSEAEALSIKSNLVILESEKADIDKEFTTLYGNPSLTGTHKTNLNNWKNAYNTAHANLLNSIKTAIADSNITEAERTDISNKFSAYNIALTNYRGGVQISIDAIADAKSNGAYSNAKQYADGLKTTTDMSISEVNNAVGTLRRDVTTTIKDGIVSEAEALAIKSNIQLLNSEKADIDKEFTTIYANTNLTGPAKTDLNSKKTAYNTAHTNLVNSITNATADSNVTASEKSDIDSKFNAYGTALANYKGALQTAIDNIADNRATNAVDNITFGVRNEWLFGNFEGVRPPAISHDGEIVSLSADNPTGFSKAFHSTSTNSKVTLFWKPDYTKNGLGKTYTFSCWVKYTNIVQGTNSWNALNMFKHNLRYKKTDGTETKESYDTPKGFTGTSDWVQVSYQFTYSGSSSYTGMKTNLWIGLEGVASGEFWVTGIQVVEGNKALATWTPALEDTASAINDAVKDLPSLGDVTSASNNAVIKANIETIKQSFKTITTEYNNNLQQANTTYNNIYLTGTAKSNLSAAKSDYTTKYNAVKSAHDSIVNADTLTTDQLNNWNTSITNLQTATTKLALRLTEANNYISTAIYNASKNYTDGAIPDALTGYAKTSYVDDAKDQAIEDAKKGMVSSSDLEVNNSEILMTTSKMGQYNILRNSDFRNGTDHWFKYTESVVPSSWGVVTDTDAVVISGEKAMRTWHNTGSGNVYHGYYQDVTLQANTSYTLSFWMSNYNCIARVGVWQGTANNHMIAAKVFSTSTNGNHSRESWKYDSITFTAKVAGTFRILFQVQSPLDTSGYGLFIIKPMLCTGINAQAWTGHPDEIYVGVVSITEEHGIKVEHSDSNTYSTLDATGLKIWEYKNDTPVASFGDGNTAYIDTVSTKKLIAENVTPTITVDGDYAYYFSNTGSGDYSGKNSSNCIAGFTGAMAKMCDDFGIDRTHTRGNFMMHGNGSINFFCHGSVHDENIHLENIYGGANFTIGFVKEISVSGSFNLVNIQCPFRIFGNRGNNSVNEGAIFKRGAIDGIYIKHCSRVEVAGVRFTSSQNSSNSGIACVDGSNVYIKHCDINKFKWGIYVARQSTAYIVDNRGTSGFCGCYAPDTATIIYRGSIPAGHTNHDVPHNIYLAYDSVRLSDNPAGASPQYSLQSTPPVTSQTITNSFSPTAYRCVANYTIDGEIRQGSWNGATGDWTGYIFFGGAAQSFLSGGSNSSGQIYLQRRNTAHGHNSPVPVIIAGNNVGTLAQGEGKWFNIPSSVISAIASGNPVTLTGKGNSQYIKFESNSTIRLTTTKRV